MATQVEKDHVHSVYSQIAQHFSDTRFKPWPKIAEFLCSLPKGSFVADIGCGNGKYFGVNPAVYMLGSDICPELVALAGSRGNEVVISDCLRLPYRSSVFDAAICIAVIHHLSTHERRCQALRELMRVLRPGGCMLVYVWAMEQTRKKFTEQDVMVPWRLQPQYAKRCERDHLEKHRGVDKCKIGQETGANSAEPANRPRSVLQQSRHNTIDDGKVCESDCSIPGPLTHEENLTRLGYQTFHRYYHVFRTGELAALVRSAVPTANITEEYYDHENWCVLAKKG